MLLRLLALLGLLWTGKQVFTQASSRLRSRHRDNEGQPTPKPDDEIVKDPVCLTYIPKSLAVQKMVNDKNWYFCSEECAEKFFEQQRES